MFYWFFLMVIKHLTTLCLHATASYPLSVVISWCIPPLFYILSRLPKILFTAEPCGSQEIFSQLFRQWQWGRGQISLKFPTAATNSPDFPAESQCQIQQVLDIFRKHCSCSYYFGVMQKDHALWNLSTPWEGREGGVVICKMGPSWPPGCHLSTWHQEVIPLAKYTVTLVKWERPEKTASKRMSAVEPEDGNSLPLSLSSPSLSLYSAYSVNENIF